MSLEIMLKQITVKKIIMLSIIIMLLRKIKSDIRYLSFGTNKRKQQQEEEDQEDCSICYLPLSENPPNTRTKCNHHFHTACLCRWFHSNKTSCPLCRAQFTTQEIDEICQEVPKPPSRARRKINFDDYENAQRRIELGIPPSRRLSWDD